MKRLGDYIRPVDVRNRDLKVTRLLGVSITKEFMPSIANIVGTDLSAYKVVTKGQFAYGPVTSRNGDKISVALLDGYDDAIISQAYTVFEVVDTNALDPEYLMMWFRRPEFDRYARFHSHGSAREVFDWEEMCEVQVPVPAIEKQREIVAEYNTLATRIETNKKLIATLEQTAQTLYRHTFIDNIDPNNLPAGWSRKKLKELVQVIDNRGKTPPLSDEQTNFPLIEICALRSPYRVIAYSECEKYVDQKTYQEWFRSGHPRKKDILISTVGSLAEMKVFWDDGGCIAQNIVAFRSNEDNFALYLYEYLCANRNDLLSYEIGSVQASIKVSQVIDYEVIVPKESLLVDFDEYSSNIICSINNKVKENQTLIQMQTLLLSKMGNYNE